MVAPVFEALCGLDERFTPKSPSGRRFARAASRSSEETVKCRSAGWVLVASTSLRTGAPVWEQPPAGAPARSGQDFPGKSADRLRSPRPRGGTAPPLQARPSRGGDLGDGSTTLPLAVASGASGVPWQTWLARCEPVLPPGTFARLPAPNTDVGASEFRCATRQTLPVVALIAADGSG